MAERIIIDTDPGTDDAIAILLALNSPELTIEAITVVAGNVVAEQGVENALRIVSLAGRTDIPVAGGAQGPLKGRLVTGGAAIHGPRGLGDVRIPAPAREPDPRDAPELIVELVHASPGEITLVAIGPLTNLALALSKDPSIAEMVREVVLMGGSATAGNVTPVAEFNVYVDPEAARSVFRAGWPLTMVGLEIGWKALFRPEHLEQLRSTRGSQNDFAADVLSFLMEEGPGRERTGIPIYDATAMAAVIDRTLIRTEHVHVDVELHGELTRGQTVVNRQNIRRRIVPQGRHFVLQGTEDLEPNVRLAVDIDGDRFIDLLIERLAGR